MIISHVYWPAAATYFTVEEIIAATNPAYAALITVEYSFDLCLVVVQGANAAVV